MFSITLKLMRRNLRMLVLAGLTILIGTAFISSTFLFTNSLERSSTRQILELMGASTHVLTDDSAPAAADSNDAPATLTYAKAGRISRLPGVTGHAVVDNSPVQIARGRNQSPAVLMTLGSPTDLMSVRLQKGQFPSDDGQVALSESAASHLHAGIGDRVELSDSSCAVASIDPSACVSASLTVSGITTDDSMRMVDVSGSAVVLTERAAAGFEALALGQGNQKGVAAYERYKHEHAYRPLTDAELAKSAVPMSGMNLQIAQNADGQRAIGQIASIAGKGWRVQSREQRQDAYLRQMAGGKNALAIFLMVFGVLALLVAGLVIANTFQVLVAQRRRTLALLRAIGAKRRQLYQSVVLESMVLGLVSSVLGVALACAVMAVLQASGVNMGGNVSFFFVPDVPTFAVPIVFGVVMTVLASLSSAHMATSVTPLEALRPMPQTEGRKAGAARVVMTVLLLLITVLTYTYVAINQPSASRTVNQNSQSPDTLSTVLLPLAILGSATLFLAVVISAIWWMPGLLHGVGKLFSHAGPSAAIASANVSRNSRRVAATGTALLIGVTLVMTIATGASTFKGTMEGMEDGKFSLDVILQPTEMASGVSRALGKGALGDIRKMKGVRRAETVDYLTYPVEAKTRSDNADLNNRDLLVYEVPDSVRSGIMRGDVSVRNPRGTVIVSTRSDRRGRRNWRNGETMDIRLGSQEVSEVKGSLSLKVARRKFQIPYTPGLEGMPVIVDPADVRALPRGLRAHGQQIWIRLDDNADGMKTIGDLNARFGDKAILIGPWAERKRTDDAINQVMLVMIALLAVSVIIALIGVANTLSLSVIERAHENATLRAIGMTRRQVRRSLSFEALMISVLATLVGIVLGGFFGWYGSWVIIESTTKGMVFNIDWGITATVLVVSVLAALVSSVAPARRALRTSPVEVLSEA